MGRSLTMTGLRTLSRSETLSATEIWGEVLSVEIISSHYYLTKESAVSTCQTDTLGSVNLTVIDKHFFRFQSQVRNDSLKLFPKKIFIFRTITEADPWSKM